jgi:purine-nucleoside phosphorylase
MIEKINQTAAFLKEKMNETPEIAIILGTGLGSFVDSVSDKISIPYSEIPHFPVSTAPSHVGRLVMGKISEKPVIIMQGRFHFYEGYPMQTVTFPVRVFRQMGVKLLMVTNAAGSLNESMQPGNIVLLSDHINFMGTNPLIGENLDDMGERFPSLHRTYSAEFRQIVKDIALQKKIKICEGTYLAVSGPSLETRAECLMFQKLGADVVGMSTVPEVIVATHCGMQVIGFSIVTNLSNIFHAEAHSQAEIQANAQKAKHDLLYLLEQFLIQY